MINNKKPHREFVFGRSGGLWTINGETWDTMKIAADDVGQNTWELWKFKSGGGWHHPVHMHLIDLYILQRDDDTEVEGNAGGLQTYEQGSPKDTFSLSGGNVWTMARFGAHKGHYMFHCHNLIHKDKDMMRAYNVIHGAKNASSAAQFYENPLHGIIYNNFEYADPMLNDTAPKPTAQVPAHSFELVNYTLFKNLYRIFYPTEDDKQQYGSYYNPWMTEWCQLPSEAGATPNDPISKPTGPTHIVKTNNTQPDLEAKFIQANLETNRQAYLEANTQADLEANPQDNLETDAKADLEANAQAGIVAQFTQADLKAATRADHASLTIFEVRLYVQC